MTELVNRSCNHCNISLLPGENISEKRFNKSDYVCDNCHNTRQKAYKSKDKEKFAEYIQTLRDETIETFRVQWEDAAFKNTREISDRVYKVFDKYYRRAPEKGIRTDWILEIIFPDLWYTDITIMVNDTLDKMGINTQSKRLASKSIVSSVLLCHYEAMQETYRDKARNRWIGIKNAINRKYGTVDKIVAFPAWEDPILKERVDNWFLLSREDELKQRVASRESLRHSFDRIDNLEEHIVEEVHRREERTTQEQQDDTTSNTSDIGGENNQ